MGRWKGRPQEWWHPREQADPALKKDQVSYEAICITSKMWKSIPGEFLYKYLQYHIQNSQQPSKNVILTKEETEFQRH